MQERPEDCCSLFYYIENYVYTYMFNCSIMQNNLIEKKNK